MIQEVRLRRAGGSIAATLPKEMADRLKLALALAIAAEVGRSYRNALRELAK